MKELYLLRGLPGAGKSTLAKSIGGHHIEADMYFMIDGKYMFDATKIKDAHSWCSTSVFGLMSNDKTKIVVSNTFTQEWEMTKYMDLAKDFGYMVYSLIVENRHNGKNAHNVPTHVIDKMNERFELKL
jgi:predicted kinase